jgi:hypothetical protein
MHGEAERLASQAEAERLRGNDFIAREFYREAAYFEEQALDLSPLSRSRTKGILAVSATSLYFKGGDFESAERIALRSLSIPDLVQFARTELRDTLQVIWEARDLELTERQISPEELQVAIRGSEIGAGRAPLGLVLDKIVGVRSLLYRITELLAGIPLRVKGGPTDEIRQICQPWVSEPQAGSYRFTIRLVQPLQPALIPDDRVTPAAIGQTLLQIIRTISPSGLADFRQLRAEDAIPDAEYRSAILKLVRNLVPDGRRVREVEFTGTGGRLYGEAILHAGSRYRIEDELRTNTGTVADQDVRGILRAVDLERSWVEVITDSTRVRCRIGQQVLDDVIGPMLNRPVVARGRVGRRGVFALTDIEIDRDVAASDDLST